MGLQSIPRRRRKLSLGITRNSATFSLGHLVLALIATLRCGRDAEAVSCVCQRCTCLLQRCHAFSTMRKHAGGRPRPARCKLHRAALHGDPRRLIERVFAWCLFGLRLSSSWLSCLHARTCDLRPIVDTLCVVSAEKLIASHYWCASLQSAPRPKCTRLGTSDCVAMDALVLVPFLRYVL